MTTYRGVLTFHSETGTEGGYWAFQDEKFMNLPGPNQFRCVRCGRVWDKDADSDPPKPSFTYWRDGDPTLKGTLAASGGFHSSDTYQPDGNLGPHEFDAKWNEKCNEVSRQCAENGHLAWDHLYPNGVWSYEGLHLLADGDELTVFDGDQELFHGVVKLPPEQDPYADDAYAAGGVYTAHSRPPDGCDESWWFHPEKHATLTTGS